MNGPGPIAGGVGGGSTTDPNVGHVQSDGSAGGNGSPSAPFAIWQQAITAGFTTFKFGDGSFGDGVIATPGSTFFLAGSLSTLLGNITIPGGGTTSLIVQGIISIGNVSSAGGAGTGADAGSVNISGDNALSISSITTDGGSGIVPDGDGGDAGNITLSGPFSVGAISLVGGAPDGGGAAGADGTLLVSKCVSIPTPAPDAATVIGAIINGVFYANTYT